VRKVPLVLAALPLVLVPLTASPALAGNDASGAGSGCAIPKVATQYDAHQLTVFVSLPASGCAAREHRIFDLDMTVTRMANHWSHDVSDWTTTCGPFRSADDAEPGYPPGQYSCNLSAALDHPNVEVAQYNVDLTYPGASGERTVTAVAFCRSDADNASCEDVRMTPERDAQR